LVALATGVARLPSLTGYRFILGSAVFLCHVLAAAQFYDNKVLNGLGVIAPYGVAALSSFFVLSGFVLTWSTRPADALKLFWRRRIVKIFPNHLVTWTFTLVVFMVIAGPLPLLGAPSPIGATLTNLFLLQTLVPKPDYVLSVNGINWSVSCEVFFYLFFPFLLRPLKRIPDHRLWHWFIAMTVVIAVVPGVVNLAIHAPMWPLWPPLSFTQTWLVYFFPPVRMPEFILGVLLARIVQTGHWPNLRARWVWLFAVLVWLGTLILPAEYGRSGIFAVPFGLFIPIIASRDIHGRPSWLRRRAVVTLGDASYAMYLVHFPLLAVVRYLIGAERAFNAISGTLIIVAMFVLTQSAGLALYQYVERPLMRRFSSPRQYRKVNGPVGQSS